MERPEANEGFYKGDVEALVTLNTIHTVPTWHMVFVNRKKFSFLTPNASPLDISSIVRMKVSPLRGSTSFLLMRQVPDKIM